MVILFLMLDIERGIVLFPVFDFETRLMQDGISTDKRSVSFIGDGGEALLMRHPRQRIDVGTEVVQVADLFHKFSADRQTYDSMKCALTNVGTEGHSLRLTMKANGLLLRESNRYGIAILLVGQQRCATARIVDNMLWHSLEFYKFLV